MINFFCQVNYLTWILLFLCHVYTKISTHFVRYFFRPLRWVFKELMDELILKDRDLSQYLISHHRFLRHP